MASTRGTYIVMFGTIRNPIASPAVSMEARDPVQLPYLYRNSSQRRRRTTRSASATIRRLIFDRPTRRSRKMMAPLQSGAPAQMRSIGHLDLEDVAAGANSIEVERLEAR